MKKKNNIQDTTIFDIVGYSLWGRINNTTRCIIDMTLRFKEGSIWYRNVMIDGAWQIVREDKLSIEHFKRKLTK